MIAGPGFKTSMAEILEEKQLRTYLGRLSVHFNTLK